MIWYDFRNSMNYILTGIAQNFLQYTCYMAAFDVPMPLILKLDLDMIKMSHHTKNEISMLRHSKVIARTDRQTHTYRDTQTHSQKHKHTDGMETLPSQAVIIRNIKY